MGTNYPLNTSKCYTSEGGKKAILVTNPVRRGCKTEKTERKKKNKQAEASPREADKQREHSMTKHWAHLPHPLKHHFVFHVNNTYFVGFVPFPHLLLLQQYRILHILDIHMQGSGTDIQLTSSFAHPH